jgi:DNA-binding transcriptional MerR regulator
MSASLSQITFDFSEPPKEEEPKEFLTGNPIPKKEIKPKSTRGRKSLKDGALEMDEVNIPDDDTLFQKQYYPIGEVAAMFGVNISLIRYWEKEFDILDPRKNRKGDRLFKPTDIKNLQLIHDLLRRRKFTLEGAKEYLKKGKKVDERFAMIQSLNKIKSFLLEVKAHL